MEENTIELVLTGKSERIDSDGVKPLSNSLAGRAFLSAQAFREIVHRIRDPKDADIMPVFDQLTAIAALSCEIFLKSLIYYEKPADAREYVDGHGLLDLYNQLQGSKELVIKEMNGKYDQAKLEEELNQTNRDFIALRYTYELKSIYSNLGFIYDFMDSLYSVCDKVII